MTLREFAIALLVGMLTGAYSSIFVASPLLGWLKARSAAFAAAAGPRRDHLRARTCGPSSSPAPVACARRRPAPAAPRPCRRRAGESDGGRRGDRRPPADVGARRPAPADAAQPPAAPAQEEAPLAPPAGTAWSRAAGDGSPSAHDAATSTRRAAGLAAPLVREIPDYPQPGVTFRDITPLLGDADGVPPLRSTSSADRFADVEVDRVVGVEARGFILAAPIAYRLGAAFVPVRKAGKLPWAVVREEYELEYGRDKLEIHRDAIHPDERVLVIDDVLATGGTAAATAAWSRRSAASIVGIGFLIEIAGLGGRAALGDRRLEVLASY